VTTFDPAATLAELLADGHQPRSVDIHRPGLDDLYQALEHDVGRPPMPRDTLLRTHALVRHNLVLTLRESGPPASRILLPLVAVVVAGMLVLFSLLAVSIVGTSVLGTVVAHLGRLCATTLRPSEMLVGKAVPVLAMLPVQQVVVLGFGIGVLGRGGTAGRLADHQGWDGPQCSDSRTSDVAAHRPRIAHPRSTLVLVWLTMPGFPLVRVATPEVGVAELP
jgi:hypothetical protein